MSSHELLSVRVSIASFASSALASITSISRWFPLPASVSHTTVSDLYIKCKLTFRESAFTLISNAANSVSSFVAFTGTQSLHRGKALRGFILGFFLLKHRELSGSAGRLPISGMFYKMGVVWNWAWGRGYKKGPYKHQYALGALKSRNVFVLRSQLRLLSFNITVLD